MGNKIGELIFLSEEWSKDEFGNVEFVESANVDERVGDLDASVWDILEACPDLPRIGEQHPRLSHYRVKRLGIIAPHCTSGRAIMRIIVTYAKPGRGTQCEGEKK